ncbi:uncharacterized protein A4U43_C06F600 [Asparagus officinalis]|uniref:Uncharacterized protein n=1 Tax=Asparagus officinalis TaxID=4686 RepID=A0A5P1EJ03_ASPOF|nr:uncharacterized protein A4U43_C06F600 [Asparagus officinalis]
MDFLSLAPPTPFLNSRSLFSTTPPFHSLSSKPRRLQCCPGKGEARRSRVAEDYGDEDDSIQRRLADTGRRRARRDPVSNVTATQGGSSLRFESKDALPVHTNTSSCKLSYSTAPPVLAAHYQSIRGGVLDRARRRPRGGDPVSNRYRVQIQACAHITEINAPSNVSVPYSKSSSSVYLAQYISCQP